MCYTQPYLGLCQYVMVTPRFFASVRMASSWLWMEYSEQKGASFVCGADNLALVCIENHLLLSFPLLEFIQSKNNPEAEDSRHYSVYAYITGCHLRRV